MLGENIYIYIMGVHYKVAIYFLLQTVTEKMSGLILIKLFDTLMVNASDGIYLIPGRFFVKC